MPRIARLMRVAAGMGCVIAAAVPLAAHADTLTFDWVPTDGSSTGGSLTFTVASDSLTSGTWGGESGSIYTAASGSVTGLAFTFPSALSAEDITQLSQVSDSSITITAAESFSSALVQTSFNSGNSAVGGDPAPTQPGYYLTSGLSIGGYDSASGSLASFELSNSAGQPTLLGASDVSVGSTVTLNGATYDGYWELNVAPVPVPTTLPLLLSGLGLLGWIARRRVGSSSSYSAAA